MPCEVSAAGAAGSSEIGDGAGNGIQRFVIHRIAGSLAVRRIPHQTGRHQYLEMLRDGGLRQIEMRHDIAAAAGIAGGEPFENFQPCGMRERGELGRYRLIGLAGGREIVEKSYIHRLSAINDDGKFCNRWRCQCHCELRYLMVACSPIDFISAASPSLDFSGTLKIWPGQMRSGSLICS